MTMAMAVFLTSGALAIAAIAIEAYLRRNRPTRRLSETQPKRHSRWLDMPEHHAQGLAQDKGRRT